jgi:hypothetical protein
MKMKIKNLYILLVKNINLYFIYKNYIILYYISMNYFKYLTPSYWYSSVSPVIEEPKVEGPAVEGPKVEGHKVEGPAVECPKVEESLPISVEQIEIELKDVPSKEELSSIGLVEEEVEEIGKEIVQNYHKSYVYSLNNEYKVPPAICNYLDLPYDISMTRKSLTALLYRRFKKNNLFDVKDRRVINADIDLRDALYMLYDEDLTLNNLQEYLTRSYCMNRDFV